MKRLAKRLAIVIVPLTLSACMTTHDWPEKDVWPGLDDSSSYYLGEGGRISVSYDDDVVRHVFVRDGHLILGDGVPLLDRDLGPCAPDQPIRFLDSGRLTVSGELRVSVGLP